MKLLKDLGTYKRLPTNSRPRHYGIFQCPECGKEEQHTIRVGKANAVCCRCYAIGNAL